MTVPPSVGTIFPMTARCLALLLATFAAVALLACTSTPAASPEGGDPALFAIEPDLRVEIAMHDIRFEPSTFEVDRGALGRTGASSRIDGYGC